MTQQREQSKLKHGLGLAHSLIFLILPFIPADSAPAIDAVLRFSLVYYLQDFFWSLLYKEYLVALHHVGLAALWFFVLDDTEMLYRTEIIEQAMFWPELSACLIHVKFLFPSHLTHVTCLIVYPISRCIVFPLHSAAYMYKVGGEVGWDSRYVWGMVAHVLVVIFSTAIVLIKKQMFLAAFQCKKVASASKQKQA